MTSSPTVQISFPGTYVLTTGYKDYIVDCATGNIAITLPTITSSGIVVNITRNDTGVTGNTGNTLTVSPSATQVINRQSTPVVQANLNQLRFVSYITATETGWFYGASSATLLSIENLLFVSPTISNVSPIIDVSDITNYNYSALPSGSLADGVSGKTKNIILSDEKVAPVQVTTDRGAFVLSNQSINKTQLVFVDNFWKQLAGDDLTMFPTKQQAKLVGTGNTGAPQQGTSVSLSAGGNTVAIGGRLDNGNIGATWIFTRSGSPGVWNQQGTKLVGTGGTGAPLQGFSIALSSDGDTVAIGGPFDNSVGAVWIFIRTGSPAGWSQQGPKLIGSGLLIGSQQGTSVALSADGNTLAVGDVGDNSTRGATRIFIRSGGVWSQQGPKLVGTGFVSLSNQGTSVALSADGNTLAVGGSRDAALIGATWIFIRDESTGIWSQQGAKVVGTGNTGGSRQGSGVSLSADGNTLAVGGNGDNLNNGATWIFTRTSGVWNQQGTKLVGTGNTGLANQGISVSLSADGNTLAIGGRTDNGTRGATWIFTRSGSPAVWNQQGTKLIATGNIGTAAQGNSVSLSADANTLASGGPFDNANTGATWIFV